MIFNYIFLTLNKVLAHSCELTRDCKNSHGLKDYSEEAVEAYNKFIRKYREHLSRKAVFFLNTRDIFVRLLCSSDPVLNTFRKTCKEYGGADNCCRDKSMTSPSLTIQDEIFANLTSVDLII